MAFFNFCEIECENSFAVTTDGEASRVPFFPGREGLEAEGMKILGIETKLYDTINES